jgi:hypothetical protein
MYKMYWKNKMFENLQQNEQRLGSGKVSETIQSISIQYETDKQPINS